MTRLEQKTYDVLGLRPEELDILLHALGIQRRAGRWSKGGWRNWCAPDGTSDAHRNCMLLVAGGWMDLVKEDGHVFRVTEAGIGALRACGWKIA